MYLSVLCVIGIWFSLISLVRNGMKKDVLYLNDVAALGRSRLDRRNCWKKDIENDEEEKAL